MERNTKGILFSVFVVIGTAVVFFCLGFVVCFNYGPTHTVTTEIEYVEPSQFAEEETKTSLNSDSDHKIDLNTATLEQLMTVPGIGETYALRIIQYREEVGGFIHLEQLKEVQGVGDKRYEQWVAYFTIAQQNGLEE